MSQKKEKPSLLFFGPPGVGKSTVAKIVGDEYGFAFYEGDDEMTGEERKLVSNGQWGDANRRFLLSRMGTRIDQLYDGSNLGLVTAAAMTKEWMREFLQEQTIVFLQLVLVVSLVSQSEMEKKVADRHAAGHPITVEAFRRFTQQFEPPKIQHFKISNPQDPARQWELIEQMDKILKQLK